MPWIIGAIACICVIVFRKLYLRSMFDFQYRLWGSHYKVKHVKAQEIGIVIVAIVGLIMSLLAAIDEFWGKP